MHNLSAKEIQKRFLEKKVSAEQIIRYFLDRIHQYDDQVGAFLAVFETRAIEQAKKLDARLKKGEPLGRLAGIPVAIKDNIHVKGELTTCGSQFLKNYKAPFNATVTQLLEKEDAIIIGKTNLDEFAMGSSTENSSFQKTSNPWNLDCVAGGSSGGSAAAVAARLVPIAFGSDTGGSVRQPSAFCGVVGLKPSYGRVSRYGLVAHASSLDQIGPIAISAADIAMIMEVIGQQDPHDATTYATHAEDYLIDHEENLQGKKIGVPWHFLEDAQPETKERFEASIEVLKSLGCEIVDVDLDILRYAVATYYIISTAEASTNLSRFDGIRYGIRSHRANNLEEVYQMSRSEGFGPEVKKRILLGTYVLSSGHLDDFYKQATKVQVKIVDGFNHAFQKCDVIATPVSPIPAFLRGSVRDPVQMYLQDIYTIGVNLAHLPGISVPCGFNSEKKPLGLQLIGAKREDAHICRIAYAYEKAAPFNREIPPQFDQK